MPDLPELRPYLEDAQTVAPDHTVHVVMGSYSVTFVSQGSAWHPATVVLLGEVLFESSTPHGTYDVLQ